MEASETPVVSSPTSPVIVSMARSLNQSGGPGGVSRKKAAFFDIDETLIRGASSFVVTRELYRRRFFGWRDILFATKETMLYLVFGEDKNRLQQLTQRALNVMAGHSVEEVTAVGEDVCNELVGHRIFPGTRAILERHLKAGHEVWLISATPREVAVMIAERLGATGAVGTEVKCVNGIYQAELAAPFMHGSGKARVVRQLAMERNLDLNSSWAYSDSFNDLPMLLTVGKPNAINPDLKLRAFAMRHRWHIFDFRRLKRGALERFIKRVAETVGATWFFTLLFQSLLNKHRNH